MSEVSEKECEFFYRMAQDYHSGNSPKVFFLVYSGLEDKTIGLVNIEEAQARCNEIFKYLYLGRRFDELVAKSNKTLVSLPGGFELLGHKFETLDEVEKALNNKAFL
jgi:hypothetical protein